MDRDLQAFRDAWAASTKDDRSKPLELARKYIGAHRDHGLDKLTLEECVAEVSKSRAAGDMERAALVDAYLLATYAPQRITGMGAVDGARAIRGVR